MKGGAELLLNPVSEQWNQIHFIAAPFSWRKKVSEIKQNMLRKAEVFLRVFLKY